MVNILHAKIQCREKKNEQLLWGALHHERIRRLSFMEIRLALPEFLQVLFERYRVALFSSAFKYVFLFLCISQISLFLSRKKCGSFCCRPTENMKSKEKQETEHSVWMMNDSIQITIEIIHNRMELWWCVANKFITFSNRSINCIGFEEFTRNPDYIRMPNR